MITDLQPVIDSLAVYLTTKAISISITFVFETYSDFELRAKSIENVHLQPDKNMEDNLYCTFLSMRAEKAFLT